jgi:hypothetical protein
LGRSKLSPDERRDIGVMVLVVFFLIMLSEHGSADLQGTEITPERVNFFMAFF